MADKGEDNSVRGNTAPVQIVRTGSENLSHGHIAITLLVVAIIIILAFFAFMDEAHGL